MAIKNILSRSLFSLSYLLLPYCSNIESHVDIQQMQRKYWWDAYLIESVNLTQFADNTKHEVDRTFQNWTDRVECEPAKVEPVCVEPPCVVSECEQPVCCIEYSVWGSYLYWKPRQDYMDVALSAIEGNINIQPSGISWRKGNLVNMPSPAVSAGKVGIATTFVDCRFDVSAELTLLRAKNHIAACRPSKGFLFARWLEPNIVIDNRATFITARWKLTFANLNLELGKWVDLTSCFTIRPKIGLAFAWINQKYEGGMLLREPFVPDVIDINLAVKNKGHSFGVGPRMGVDGSWNLCSTSFDLVGSIAGDLLVTKYHLKLDQSAQNQSTVFVHSSDTLSFMQPELEMYIGLRYQQCSYSLEVGYDQQIWFYQNMIRWYNDTIYLAVPRGNLTFNGLRATLRLSF